MTGEIGAAGELVSGALAARAVEPRAGERGHGAPGALCLNCGTRLIGEHCHACGQSGHVHRSVGAIGHELLHGVFHFEGKVWRTLPMLVLRPGELTRRYVAGERARFVSPLALFLFTVFLMFAVINAVAPAELFEGMPRGVAGTEQALAEVRAKARNDLALLRRGRASAAATGQPTAELDRRIAELSQDAKFLESAQGTFKIDDATVNIGKSGSWANRAFAKAKSNPGLLAYKIQSSAYKYAWLLVPLSTPFLALLFLWRRGFGLYDHAVFVTYSLTFMMLLVIALTLAGIAGLSGGAIALAALTLPPVHIHKQLRGAYSLRRLSALWRMAVLVLFATLVLVAYVSLLLFQELSG